MASPWRKVLPILLGLELTACASPDTTLQPILMPQAPTATPQLEDCTGMFLQPEGYLGINPDPADSLTSTPDAIWQTHYQEKDPGHESTFTYYGILWVPDGNGGWKVHWEGWLDQDRKITWQNVSLIVCLDAKSWDMPRMRIEEVEVASLNDQ